MAAALSEYQYDEFQAIDRPLGEADRQALRALSSRAQITAARFTNRYEWGDFKGDPATLMERWFDLHLYFANWGTRRLMIRLPKRLVDRRRLDSILRKVDCAELRVAGENLILDIVREEVESEDWDDDGSSWLAGLAPLRADLLEGDLRLFYLLWLMAVEVEAVAPDELEPMPGIGPMTAALEAFVDFFQLDPDLVEAAAERPASAVESAPSPDAVRKVISAMIDQEKNDMLLRLFHGDPYAVAELRAAIRGCVRSGTDALPAAARTAGELIARARAIRIAREEAQARKAAAEQRRLAKEAEKARRARLDAIVRRGENAWNEVEAEIGRRNPKGYDNAASLLADLRAIAEERGAIEDFARRVRMIRERHAQKGRFIERLAAIEQPNAS
jgi:hypothetical protein